MCPEKDTKNSRLCQELGKFKGNSDWAGCFSSSIIQIKGTNTGSVTSLSAARTKNRQHVTISNLRLLISSGCSLDLEVEIEYLY